MTTSSEIHEQVRQEIAAGAPFSVEGLRALLAGWEGTWKRCLGERSPEEFDTPEKVEATAREVENSGHLEVSDEDRQELVRYWFYYHELISLPAQ